MHILAVLQTAGTSLDLSIRQAIYTTEVQESPCKTHSNQFLPTLQTTVKLPKNKQAPTQRKCLQLLKVVYPEQKQQCYLQCANLSKTAYYYLSASFRTVISEPRQPQTGVVLHVYIHAHI